MHMFIPLIKKTIVINMHTEYERKWTLGPLRIRDILEMTYIRMPMELRHTKTMVRHLGQTN